MQRPTPRAAVLGILCLLVLAFGGVEPPDLPAGDFPRPAADLAGATRVAVVGDFGTGTEAELPVAAAIRTSSRRSPYDALVTTGDNIYPDGAPEQFGAAWTKPYGWVDASGIPVIAALGNHDVSGSGQGAQMRLFGMPDRWYTRTVGRIEMIVLDANAVADPDQQRFLEQAMSSPRPAGTDWRVVVFHQPAFSCSRHQSTPAVIAHWVPWLETGHVDLVLNGHDHVYERFGPIHDVTYVVTGGGGGALYEMTTCPSGTPAPQVAVVTQHFLQVEATSTTLRVQAITPDYHLIDSVVIDRVPDGH